MIRGREPTLNELMGSDAVVVATGCTWDVSGESFSRFDRGDVSGRGAARVLALDQAIHAATSVPPSDLGRHIMIVDGTGTFAPFASCAAEARLMSRGLTLTAIANTIKPTPAIHLFFVIALLLNFCDPILGPNLIRAVIHAPSYQARQSQWIRM